MQAVQRPTIAAGVLVAMLALPLPAFATLGGRESSIEADRLHMQAALTRTTRSDVYTVYEVQSASGVVVREYVAPDGTVFGVAWQSAWMPDVRQLLGSYFDRFQQEAKAARARRKGRGPLTVQTADLVVQVSGHLRAFAGSAYLTRAVPQGVRAEAIR